MEKYYTIDGGDNVFFGQVQENGTIHGIVFCPYEEARTIVRRGTPHENEKWTETTREQCAENILANILFDIEFHSKHAIQIVN